MVHHNVPALPRDFIHRCGRTARAGRAGRAIALVSQYDVEVLLAIEEAIGRKLATLEPNEAEVLDKLHEVASARRAALLELTENGFLEREKERRAEKKALRLASAAAGGAGGEIDGEGGAEEGDGDGDSEEEEEEHAPAAGQREHGKQSKRKPEPSTLRQKSATGRGGGNRHDDPHASLSGTASNGGKMGKSKKRQHQHASTPPSTTLAPEERPRKLGKKAKTTPTPEERPRKLGKKAKMRVRSAD